MFKIIQNCSVNMLNKIRDISNEIITTKGDKDKAEVLAEFFRNVFTIEPKGGIPILNSKDITFKCEDIMIKEKELLDLFLNVNQKSDRTCWNTPESI